MLPCVVWKALSNLFGLYLLLMLVYAVVSWIPSLRGRWTDYLAMVIEPVLTPVRRIIPPLGGLDLSFLVVFIVLQFVMRLAAGEPCAP
ncbi:MAG: YggT family protein [Candidatus Eremiobacteraeota bacterium]|nr:YggT family protein [Candidatus Eremiobacteraeota bacterium]MBV9408418.1 YggT family protein [Candidatus Eremiobacteraeota bacterium]